MATNLFEQYGIKEVADVTFYELTNNTPVLFLDTLKVSSIEQTGEQTEARGGKGNAPLIIWDYGKEITLNIEDALYSPASMAIMFGIDHDNNKEYKTVSTLTRMKKVTGITEKPTNAKKVYLAPEEAGGSMVEATSFEAKNTYYIEEEITTSGTQMIINADTFPGTYRVVGETYARGNKDGEDRYFQFEIPKAKMNSEQTITLEAEGDPTVFNMSLRVLRNDAGEMIKLTQYDVYGPKGDLTKN